MKCFSFLKSSITLTVFITSENFSLSFLHFGLDQCQSPLLCVPHIVIMQNSLLNNQESGRWCSQTSFMEKELVAEMPPEAGSKEASRWWNQRERGTFTAFLLNRRSCDVWSCVWWWCSLWLVFWLQINLLYVHLSGMWQLIHFLLKQRLKFCHTT